MLHETLGRPNRMSVWIRELYEYSPATEITESFTHPLVPPTDSASPWHDKNLSVLYARKRWTENMLYNVNLTVQDRSTMRITDQRVLFDHDGCIIESGFRNKDLIDLLNINGFGFENGIRDIPPYVDARIASGEGIDSSWETQFKDLTGRIWNMISVNSAHDSFPQSPTTTCLSLRSAPEDGILIEHSGGLLTDYDMSDWGAWKGYNREVVTNILKNSAVALRNSTSQN